MTWIHTLIIAVLGVALFLCTRLRIVRDFEGALLVRAGRVVRALGPGVYRVFRTRTQIEVFDLRETTVTLPIQEVTTKDRVPVKASLSITYQISDPWVLRKASQGGISELHRTGQLALREGVLAYGLDELLEDKRQVADQILPAMAEELARLGFVAVRIAVLDVIVRGEIKRAYGDVIVARAEAKARLERTRGESASLRNLANAARLLKDNEGLYQLRLLETARAAASSEANSLVLGLSNGLDLKNGRA